MVDMNATMNGSVVIPFCSSMFNPTAHKIWETIAYCLIFVVSLFGNSFIALIVYKTQSMRKPINFFIVNMAMSDLLFPIFVLPPNLSSLYVGSGWFISGTLGQALCKLSHFAMYTSMAVSIQSLVLIAVNRFGAVVFPLRSPLISSKLCRFVIMATWIVAMAVISPMLLAVNLVEYQGQQQCIVQLSEFFEGFSSLANYFLAIYVVFYYIPLVLLVILYSIILIKVKSQKIPGEQSINAEEQRERRNIQVLRMAIAIVIGFVLCWVPSSIGVLLFFFAPFSCWLIPYLEITNFVALANCAVNPCICFIFSGNYRRGLKILLTCFR